MERVVKRQISRYILWVKCQNVYDLIKGNHCPPILVTVRILNPIVKVANVFNQLELSDSLRENKIIL